MRHDVDARLTAIAAELERRRLEQEWPEDDLSRSLGELGRELAGLDALGKSALLYEPNHSDPLEGTMSLNLSMEDLERFIADFGDNSPRKK